MLCRALAVQQVSPQKVKHGDLPVDELRAALALKAPLKRLGIAEIVHLFV